MPQITPFDRIDAAQEYLIVLDEVISDNREKVDAELMEATAETSPRCIEVLKLVSYNLESLDKHLKASSRTLNNLRKLRGVLLNETAANSPCQNKIHNLCAIEAPISKELGGEATLLRVLAGRESSSQTADASSKDTQ